MPWPLSGLGALPSNVNGAIENANGLMVTAGIALKTIGASAGLGAALACVTVWRSVVASDASKAGLTEMTQALRGIQGSLETLVIQAGKKGCLAETILHEAEMKAMSHNIVFVYHPSNAHYADILALLREAGAEKRWPRITSGEVSFWLFDRPEDLFGRLHFFDEHNNKERIAIIFPTTSPFYIPVFAYANLLPAKVLQNAEFFGHTDNSGNPLTWFGLDSKDTRESINANNIGVICLEEGPKNAYAQAPVARTMVRTTVRTVAGLGVLTAAGASIIVGAVPILVASGVAIATGVSIEGVMKKATHMIDHPSKCLWVCREQTWGKHFWEPVRSGKQLPVKLSWVGVGNKD